MEPLAHTLTGACLAEAGLKRATPLASATLLIAVNLPDIDGACYLSSADLAFGFRRGWTHGILAWIVLPIALTCAMRGFDVFVRRRRNPALEPASTAALAGLALLGVLTHPFLDWLNNYGIRLLMPLSTEWFYGDTLFIVDPWIWILLGGAAALAWTRTRPGIAVTALMALALTTLVWGNPLVPSWARALWVVALVAWVGLRWLLPVERVRLAARVALALAMLYIGVNIAGSRVAEAKVRDLARLRGWNVDRVAAMPQPIDPARRVVIAVTPSQYWFVPVEWARPLPADAPAEAVPRGRHEPAVESALNSAQLQGTRQWLRFPSYEVESRKDGTFRVLVRDARFAVGNRPGFGVVAVVDLDRNLRPLAPEP